VQVNDDCQIFFENTISAESSNLKMIDDYSNLIAQRVVRKAGRMKMKNIHTFKIQANYKCVVRKD